MLEMKPFLNFRNEGVMSERETFLSVNLWVLFAVCPVENQEAALYGRLNSFHSFKPHRITSVCKVHPIGGYCKVTTRVRTGLRRVRSLGVMFKGEIQVQAEPWRMNISVNATS